MPAYRCVRAAITEVSSLQMPTKVGCSFLVFPNVPFLKKLCAGYMQEVLSAEHLLHHRHTKEGRGVLSPPLLELPTPGVQLELYANIPLFLQRNCGVVYPLYNLLRGGCRIALRYPVSYPHLRILLTIEDRTLNSHEIHTRHVFAQTQRRMALLEHWRLCYGSTMARF